MVGLTETRSEGLHLYIDPFTQHFLDDRLFDPTADARGDDSLGTWVYLRQWFGDRGVPVHTADLLPDPRPGVTNVYISLGMQERSKRLATRDDVISSALFLFEAPIVQPFIYRRLRWSKDCFRRIYTFSDAPSLARFIPESVELDHFAIPFPNTRVDEAVWSDRDRDFLVMINSNRLPRVFVDELYTERLRALAFFGEQGEIDLYGVGWDVPPYRPYEPWIPATLQRAHRALIAAGHRVRPDAHLEAARRVYRGTTPSKIETLGRYTYAVCFENQILKGWVTEKMFDCFRAGTVPIYRGAPNIEELVPADAYIDGREFDGYGELRAFLRSLAPSRIQQYREAGRAFFGSPQFRPFSKELFVERVADILFEDTGVDVR